MSDNIGPHLLGRVPSPPDERDYKLGDYISPDPLDTALATLVASKAVAKATKDWASFITQYLKSLTPSPMPVPVPVPVPTEDIIWANAVQLDQKNTGHCVGFGWAQWGNSEPVVDSFTNADGHAIYYECKIIDGEPEEENGSDVRSGAKAMKNRKRLNTYAFADVSTLDEIKTWVRTKGPLVIGSDWTEDMFTPDAKGFVKPIGQVAGGHCYDLIGDIVSEGAFLFKNSWGTTWGLKGIFKMKYNDFLSLLENYGEACTSVELPK
jgi:hypothetical protein